MKKTLVILGVGIVAGVVAYAMWHKMHKEDKLVASNFGKVNDNANSPEKAPVVVYKTTIEEDVAALKSTVVNNMTARHEEAAQIMKDAVENICKRSEVSENETKELEQISSELDDLLSEE